MSQPPNPTELDLELLYSEARAQLDRQFDNWDALDAKIGVLFAFSGAEVAAVAAFLALPHPALPTLPTAIWMVVFVLIYVAVAALSIYALWAAHAAEVGVDLFELTMQYVGGASKSLVKERAIETLNQNQDKVGRTLTKKRFALGISLIGTACLTVAVILTGLVIVVASPSQSSQGATVQPQTTASSAASPAPSPSPSHH